MKRDSIPFNRLTCLLILGVPALLVAVVWLILKWLY